MITLRIKDFIFIHSSQNCNFQFVPALNNDFSADH